MSVVVDVSAVILGVAMVGQVLLWFTVMSGWRRDRRQRKRMRMRVEVCEHPGCGAELRPHEVYELRSTPEDDGELGIVGGGTWMSAVFCRKHYPEPLPRRSVWSRVARRRHP